MQCKVVSFMSDIHFYFLYLQSMDVCAGNLFKIGQSWDNKEKYRS